MAYNIACLKYPKPSQSQTFYPYPPNLLTPNRRLRSLEQQIDARTANILANKERELMQTTSNIDYYADGLGTRAPLNSDDLDEKYARILATSQVVDDKMKPYFRKGDGITLKTTDKLIDVGEYELKSNSLNLPRSNNIVLTSLERDEIRLENGNDYKNFPPLHYQDNVKMPTFKGI